MNRNQICMMSISILALTAASGLAIAQNRDHSPRNAVVLAERSARTQTSLADAISLAEKHTKGVAIGVRLMANREVFHTESNGLREFRDRSLGEKAPAYVPPEQDKADAEDADGRPGKPSTAATDRGRDTRTNMPMTPDADRWQDSTKTLFAVVTCVIDQARVRDVVIDMSDGSVLGMQSVNASAFGMNRETSRGMDRDGQYSEGQYTDPSRFSLVRASDLMNATARNTEGQRIGDIDELVLNPDSNRIVYGVLRRGGFLGMNESRYAVSTNELSVPKDGGILVNLNNSDFMGHSGFDDKKWPTQADPEWSTRWNSDAEKPTPATRILKASDLIGTSVQCSEGQKVGTISDLIVEPRSGRVVYAIVESDRGELVVPMSVLQSKGEARVMKMTHAEVMALPTLDADSDPDWSDARWNRRIHDNYKAKMDLTAAQSERSRP
jgi:sporulation protein YlmC with PRC-barrel domain